MFGFNADEWQAIGTMAAAIIALIALGFAARQVIEARKTREEQAQPFVVVDFESNPTWVGLVDLVIQNLGQTLAKDITFTFDQPLKSAYSFDKDIMDMPIIARGIPALPPRKTHRVLFERLPERVGSGLPNSYEVTVNFSDARGRKQEPLTYRLDLESNFHYRQVSLKGLHHAGEALEEISKLLKKWDRHGNGMGVWVNDEDARTERENAEMRQALRERDNRNAQSETDGTSST